MAERIPGLRLFVCFFIVLGLYLASAPSGFSQSTAPAATAALPLDPAQPEHQDLKAGPVSGRVTVLRSAKPFPAGGSAFATIEVSAQGKAKLAGTQILFETGNAEIRNVTGAAVSVDGAGNARIAKIVKTPKRGSVKIVVELTLTPDGSGAESNLKVTLRNPDGGDDTTRVAWPVIDCAGGFYSEIVKVRNSSGSRIANAVKASQAKDGDRPGRWLFRPQAATTARRGKCLKSVKRWSRRHGRSIYICTRFKEIAKAGAPSPVPFERKVFRFASRLVSSRARDYELAPGRDSGWAIRRVSQNLDGFLKQPPHPAICNGPIAVFDYFDARMAGFMKRAATYDDMAAKSYALALLRTVEAITTLRSRESGHPGWGNAPLLPENPGGEMSLKTMAERLARATGDVALGDAVAHGSTVYSGLKAMAGFMKGDAAGSLDKEALASLTRALAALEAADYIAAVAGRYIDLRHALAGSMAKLRKAHGEKCTCGG